MASDRKKRLQELRGSDFELAKGQPDIRGWEVTDSAGHRMGKVHELIFDTEARRVRYLVLKIEDSKELQLEKRTVLVPIGLAELHRAHDSVVLPQVTPFQLRALPKYDKTHLGPKAETDISTVFGRSHTALGSDDAHSSAPFYEHEHFNEANLYRNRQGGSTGEEEEDRRLSDEAAEAALTPTRETGDQTYTPKGSSADAEGILRNREQTLRDEREAGHTRQPE